MMKFERYEWVAIAIMISLFIFVGFIQGWSVSLVILNMCIISAIMTMGVNISWGYAGVINFGVMVKKVPGMSAEDEAAFIQGYVDANNFAFGQDVAIWENKIYIPDPVVCDGDGPLHKLRKWYGQFLVNRADIPSGLDLEKREF